MGDSNESKELKKFILAPGRISRLWPITDIIIHNKVNDYSFPAVIDTAASHVIIPSNFAKEMGLRLRALGDVVLLGPGQRPLGRPIEETALRMKIEFPSFRILPFETDVRIFWKESESGTPFEASLIYVGMQAFLDGMGFYLNGREKRFYLESLPNPLA